MQDKADLIPVLLPRQIVTAGTAFGQRSTLRATKRHSVWNPEKERYEPGPRLKPLTFRSFPEQRHATGALKRSERQPQRKNNDGLLKRAWSYVSR